MNRTNGYARSHTPAGGGRRAPSRQRHRPCPSLELRADGVSISIRTRIVLFASLACLLPQLTWPAPASTRHAGAVRVSVSAQLPHKAHLAVEGARASLPESVLDRLLTAPFAPAALADLVLSARSVAGPALDHAEACAHALVILPPSRAPPALS